MDSMVRPATRREWLGLAVIMLPCMLYSMDLTVLNLALPALSLSLHPSSAELLWIVDIYGFLLAGTLIPMGALGDRVGRRRLLLIGACAFGVLSVIAAFSVNPAMLIVCRALLGVAGATLAPSTLSLIRNMFGVPRQRTLAIGLWSASYSLGAVLGPLLGGLLLQHFWWGSGFLIGVPPMLLLLLLGPLVLPESRDSQTRPVDVISALMSLASVLLLILAFKRMALQGFSWAPLGCALAGVTLGTLFVRRQRSLREPLLDLTLFTNAACRAALLTYALSIFVLFGCWFAMAQYFQLVLSFSPLTAGLWTLPASAALVFASLAAPLSVRYLRPERAAALDMCIAAMGCALLASVTPRSSILVIVAGDVLIAFGIAPVATLATDRVVGFAPPERAGAASALSETAAELGAALGLAVLGSVVSGFYRLHMSGAALAGVSAPDASSARDTLSGAVTVAANLPAPLGSQLLARANSSFTDGMRGAALLGFVLLVFLAILNARSTSFAERS